MFSLGPSVFLVLRVKLEVQVFNKVLEGSNEFTQWASGFNLEFHQSSGDFSPTGFFHVLNCAFHAQLEGGLDLHRVGKSNDNHNDH